MLGKLPVWLVLLQLCVVAAVSVQSSDASHDVALSKAEGESAVNTTSARRRRRRRRAGGSSSGGGDISSIKNTLKEISDELKKLKDSFTKGLESLGKAVEEKKASGGGGGGPSPRPSPRPSPKPTPTPSGPGKCPMGHNVGFHNAKANRFLRMHGHGKIDASETKDVDKFPPTWGWEKFWTRDIGGGKVGFYCASHGKWMSCHGGTKMWSSNPGHASRNPGGWEQFRVESAGGGKIKIKTHRNTYVRIQGTSVTHVKDAPEDEITYTVVDLGKSGPPAPPQRG